MECSFARVAMVGMAALCLARSVQPPAVIAQQVKSQWDAIYSEPQARRGQALYVENCVICHAGTLGGTDAAPALAGAAFIGKSKNKPLDELFEFMQIAMPVQSPGGLSRQQNADILAYMLQAGNFPSGPSELIHDRNVLRYIYLVEARPGGSTALAAASPDAPHRSPRCASSSLSTELATAERGSTPTCKRTGDDCSSTATAATVIPSIPKFRTFRSQERCGRTTRSADGISSSESKPGQKKKLYPSVDYTSSRDWRRCPLPIPARSVSRARPTSSRTSSAPMDFRRDRRADDGRRGNEIDGDRRTRVPADFQRPRFHRHQVHSLHGCRPAPLGCGKSDPGSVVWVKDGMIACACNVHGSGTPTEVPELHAAVRLQVQAAGGLGCDAGQRPLPGAEQVHAVRARRDRAASF